MKRLILPLLCFFVLASSSFAWMTLPVVGGGAATGSWEHILGLEENEADTTVANAGTIGTAWVSRDNTVDYHDASAKVGSGCFNFDAVSDGIYTDTAWTDEQVIFQFWWKPANATAADTEIIGGIGDGDYNPETNEIMINRLTGTDELRLTIHYGAVTRISSTDFAPSADTWYQLRFEIDCSGNGWTPVMKYRTSSASEWTTLSLGAWDNGAPNLLTLNNNLHFGTYSEDVEPDAMFDDIRIRSGTN